MYVKRSSRKLEDAKSICCENWKRCCIIIYFASHLKHKSSSAWVSQHVEECL
jgi:hypothetical protein